MAKKTVNSDIYNLSKLVDDVKQVFIPNESEDTLSIGTYGYFGALESSRLQTQVQMTGELCNESFPSRARLDRNVITHAIMTNIEDINAIPSKMTVYLALRESDILEYFDDDNIFIIDRECPINFDDYEFHLEYDIKLKRIYIETKNAYTYTAQYIIPSDREVPTSTITTSNQYLAPPSVLRIGTDTYIYITVVLSQVEHTIDSKKLVTSNIIDNKTVNFEFENQLSYFEIYCKESDQEYYVLPVFEGASIPESNYKYYCWYQYIDSNLIRVRFDRQSYMPGLNATVECLIKTCRGASGNFTYGENIEVSLESSLYGYKGINVIVTPVSDATGGKDRKSKTELQSLIPKEALSRGNLTTITDLNNYFGMLDSDLGRIIIQKKIDNQKERVYYAYFIAKDSNSNVIPSNTIDLKVGLEDLKESKVLETDNLKYMLPFNTCFLLGEDGIGYVNHQPLLLNGEVFTPSAVKRGQLVETTFEVEVVDDEFDQFSCGVDIGDASTSTHIFPEDDTTKREVYKDYDDNTFVEDYIQMGCGHNYTYTYEYIAKMNDSIIKATDLELPCFNLKDAYYTVNDETKHFDKLPIEVYGMSEGTRILFGITRQLNEKAIGIITFTYQDNEYKYNQITSGKLSTILASFGFEGEVQNAVSNNEDIITLTENGTIDGYTSYTLPDPLSYSGTNEKSSEPYQLFVAKDGEVPSIESREENQWFYVIEDAETRTDTLQSQSDTDSTNGNAYKLTVVNSSNVPPIEDRQENEWLYIIQGREERQDGEETDSINTDTDATYTLDVTKEEDLPPISERSENEWFYVIEKTTGESPEPTPTGLRGKEYDIDILRNFEGESASITITIDGEEYTFTLSQNRRVIENGIIVTEDTFTESETYTTYTPTFEQDTWPEEVQVGDKIKYTLKYLSTGNYYTPEITIKLSRGLEYVLYSNYVTYPGKDPISYEPTEVSLEKERGFVYCNPYAVNINGYRLYSSFYMMALEENPYLHFEYVNDSSNIQFISTNIKWSRSFGDTTNKYKMSIDLMQSVQEDLELISVDSGNNTYAGVKAFVVLRRDNKNYRYRSMILDAVDTSTYSFSFSCEFDSLDLFDQDNNIKVDGLQVTGQKEFSIDITYGDKSYTLNNGESVLLTALITSLELPITTFADITSILSSNNSSIIVSPVLESEESDNIVDYSITAIRDSSVDESVTITIKDTTTPVILTCESNFQSEYGFFNPTTDMKIYVICNKPDILGTYSKNDFNSICPGYDEWTLTNTYKVVNGVTMYHNYSEVMGSRVRPYGTEIEEDGVTKLQLEGYYIDSVPVIGYDYCQNEVLVQEMVNSLNYRKSYIDSSLELLENSFGIDFKLFNTYGPSKLLYVIRDTDNNGYLDNEIEYIGRVDISMSFRIKLTSTNDSYTRDNVILDIKDYVEDLEDIGELHIPNLISYITNKYSEQLDYIEYLGLNDGQYGPDVQHIYKTEDDLIPIHAAPEFINVHNIYDNDGTLTPDINIYVSEI